MKRWAPISNPGPGNSHRNFNESTAERGSFPDARGYQQMLDELVTATTKAGFPESEGDSTQLAAAIQSGGLNVAEATGSANAWVVTLDQPIAQYKRGRHLWIKAPATNTTTDITVDISSRGARQLRKANGRKPAIGDIVGGEWYPVFDDGAVLQLQRALPSDWGTGEIPLLALPFPEVYTADKIVGITVGAKAGQGGYLLLTGGEILTLGRATSGGLGISRRAVVPAADFGSTNANHLAVSSTYYLRGYLDADYNLVVYLQRGTDADAPPPGLIGSPGSTANGGFDSTQLDILLARIVTGAAGTAPVMTRYANAARLTLVASRSTPALGSTSGVNTVWSSGGESVYIGASGGVNWTLVFPLLWARKPSVIMVAGAYNVGTATAEQYLSGYAGVLTTSSITRDAITAVGATDYSEANVWSGGTLNWTNHSGTLRIVANV